MAVKLKWNNMALTVVHLAYLYCLFALLMLNVCFALYEDQVGLFDWRQQYIGNTKQVYFEQSTHSKRVFASTEENVLAALNARTGQIMWRKVFERNDGVVESLLHSSNLLVTVSASGRTARSWDPNKGHLIWESTIQTNAGHDTPEFEMNNILKGHYSLIVDEEDIGGIVIASKSVVRLISQSDGSDIWEFTLEEPNSAVLGVTKLPERIIVFCSKFENDKVVMKALHLEMENGKLVDEISFDEHWLAQADTSCEIVSNRFLACLVPKVDKILVNDFTSKTNTFVESHLIDLTSVEMLPHVYTASLKVLSASSDKMVIEIGKTHFMLVTINDNSTVRLLKEIQKPGFYSEVYLSKQKYIFEVFKDNIGSTDTLQINVYRADEKFKAIKKLETKINLGIHSGMGIPKHGTVFAYSKREDINYRIVVNFEDSSLSLIQNMGNNVGKVLWVRNEALSGVTFSKMIELPPSTSASKLELFRAEFAAAGGILTMFINRVKSQVRQLQAYMENLKKHQQRYLDVNQPSSKGDVRAEPLTRDQFNIFKIALFMTKSRKLFAINTQNGEIVWSYFLNEINPHNVDKHVTIIEQRTTAHFPDPPQCILIAHLDGGSEHQTAIYTFNPLNGEGLDKPVSVHPFKVLQVAELPIEDEKSLKVISIVDTDHNLHIVPKSSHTIEKALLNLDKMYVYLVNKTENSFVGYKIRYTKGTFSLYEVWRVNVPIEQRIEKLKSKRNDEVVHSVGRVLGDHTVLYKYLNPNLLGFMTLQGSGVKGAVFVYIVDAVTGQIVYQARHKGADSPFDLILSEHWLVYSYYNSKGRRIELAVVEFFEGYEEKNNTAFSSLDPIGPPMVLSQGYLLPVGGISSLTTTCTERGITNKNILIGLENGYVYSIPKNFLDPRRSFKQTPMLQEEGVPQYMPELPLMPQGYINYNQTVQRIRGIHTSAAGLESTSLVLVYGLDLYYTRVTPSKMFDVLKEDFDYIFISGVLSLLVMTSIICSKLASMRALKLAWQ